MNDIELTVSDSFFLLFDIKNRYLFLYGGRGSGKSEFAARKKIKRCVEEGGHRMLIMRKVRKTLKDSVIKVMLSILDANKIKYKYNKSDRVISFYSLNGLLNELLFEGLDDPEKLKSIKGITSIWIEEITEFTREDFLKVDLVLREETTHYKQIMATFNPDEALAPWIKEDFFDKKQPDCHMHHSTVEDNPIKAVREEYLRVLDRIESPTFIKIYRYGKWALAKGIIFDWTVEDLPTDDESWYDDVFYGGDFGFSITPAAYVKIYRKANLFWVEEKLYSLGLTNQAMAEELMKDKTIDMHAPSYWDAAEPKSIEELHKEGMNAMPCLKGKDSVKAGIDFLLSMRVIIVTGSQNLINERKRYRWAVDKNDKALPVPVKFMCDLMDATRYGIYTHCIEELEESWVTHAGMKDEKKEAEKKDDSFIGRKDDSGDGKDKKEKAPQPEPKPKISEHDSSWAV